MEADLATRLALGMRVELYDVIALAPAAAGVSPRRRVSVCNLCSAEIRIFAGRPNTRRALDFDQHVSAFDQHARECPAVAAARRALPPCPDCQHPKHAEHCLFSVAREGGGPVTCSCTGMLIQDILQAEVERVRRAVAPLYAECNQLNGQAGCERFRVVLGPVGRVHLRSEVGTTYSFTARIEKIPGA